MFPAALLIDASAASSSVGVLPGEKIGTTTHTAGSMTRVASQSCGGSVSVTGCHRIMPFLTKVGVLVGQRVLDQNQSTPVRLFVNAPGVKFSGAGCDDGNNNYSVLGAPLPPTIGNASFRLEAHGLPPSARFLLMVSVGGNVPGFDMSPLGAPGCVLRTTLQIQALGVTSAGDAVRSAGKVILPAPIPKDTSPRGLILSMQIGAIDGKPKRAFPMVVTDGIEVTIQ